jgi:hypothetical protein
MMATESITDYIIKSYPKHIRASNYYLPNLIGKDIIMFFIRAKDLNISISNKDSILYNSKKYLIDSYSSHIANNEVIMYKVLAVKA